MEVDDSHLLRVESSGRSDVLATYARITRIPRGFRIEIRIGKLSISIEIS